MHLGIPSEHADGERRVAATPMTVTALIELGFDVVIETGAGVAAGFTDDAYRDAGATVVRTLGDVSQDSPDLDVVVSVGPVAGDSPVRSGGVVVGLLDPLDHGEAIRSLRARGVTPIAMESVPRTTLAQAMDALSSQATAAGYAAVLLGATELPKFMPMLVTAAGTVPPAKVLVLGVGVAGLQAIATAKRLGAVVSAYDIRPETREQVESLGARFVDAPTQEMDEGGYARTVDADIAARQQTVLAEAVADADLVITTAQVPGRRAPLLVDEAAVASMRPGSVIVDMAAASGGNVAGTRPDEVITIGGVRIHGPTDLAARVGSDASRMYARNVLELVKRIVVDGAIVVDPGDAVVGPAIVGDPDTAPVDRQEGPADE